MSKIMNLLKKERLWSILNMILMT